MMEGVSAQVLQVQHVLEAAGQVTDATRQHRAMLEKLETDAVNAMYEQVRALRIMIHNKLRVDFARKAETAEVDYATWLTTADGKRLLDRCINSACGFLDVVSQSPVDLKPRVLVSMLQEDFQQQGLSLLLGWAESTQMSTIRIEKPNKSVQ